MKHCNKNQMHVRMGELCVEIGSVSLNKKKEYLCGDYFRIAENDTDHALVLSDGLGSGVKANILSTLTATMLCNLIIHRIPLEEAVRTITKTLPICSVRKLAYSTFTIFDIRDDIATLYQYDNPEAIVIRDGEIFSYPVTTLSIDGKTVLESTFPLREDDLIILMSDGITNAGMGKTTNGGWGIDAVRTYCRKKAARHPSAREMAVILADAGVDLNLQETDDDITVIVLKIRKRQMANLMIGPPENQDQDSVYLKQFFESEGLHAVCGGTTAKIAARYLHQEIQTIAKDKEDDLPARLRIEGVDLATEGYLTIERLLEYCREWEEDPLRYPVLIRRNDSAAHLGRLLFEQATGIRLFFGNAINAANTREEGSRKKEELIRELCRRLEEAGKEVEIAYWAV